MRILVILFFLSSISTQAQIVKSLLSFDEYEFTAGPNFFRIYKYPETDKLSGKIGLSLSTNLLYELGERTFIGSKFFYDRKGYITMYKVTYEDPDDGLTKQGEARVETFSNTLGAGLSFRLVPVRHVFIEITPVVSRFIRGHSIKTYSWNAPASRYDFDVDDRYYVGGCFSLGYNFKLRENLFIGLRVVDYLNLTYAKTNTVSLQLSISLKPKS